MSGLPSGGNLPLTLVPVRWTVEHPVEAEPLGEIVLEDGRYIAAFRKEPLGSFPSGDAAATAIWQRFLDHVHARHDAAGRTHGSDERHPRR